MSRPQARDAGETIFSPFNERQEIFFIDTGFVFAYTHDKNGKRRIHIIYGPGSYFPVITAFKNRPQRATYETLTRVTLSVWSKADFLEKVNSDPIFSRKILDQTVEQLSIFADRVVNLQDTGLEEKLLRRLQVLAKEYGVKEDGYTRLPYKLKHHHLADMLGVERESVSRALARLIQKEQLIKTPEGFLEIY